MSYGILSGKEIAEAVERQREYSRLLENARGCEARTGLGWWERYKIAKLGRLPRIHIDGFDPAPSYLGGNLGTNSYDLNIGSKLLVYTVPRFPVCAFQPQQVVSREAFADAVEPYTLDPRKENPTKEIMIPPEGCVLLPGRLYLASTRQYTETHNLVPNIDGRSSVGRLGLACHVTAGRGDCAFSGVWTLELYVVGNPVRIRAGDRICQLSYQTISPDSRPYRGRYQGSRDVVASKFHEND